MKEARSKDVVTVAQAEYYRALIQQAPGLIFLKTYRATEFSYDFSGVFPRVCEISFIQEGRLLETTQDGTVSCEPGTVYTFVRDRKCRHWSDAPQYHAFEVALRFHTPLIPMTAEEVCRWIPKDNQVILPTRVEDSKTVSRLEKHIKKAVTAYREGDRTCLLAVRAELMDIFSIATSYALDRARRGDTGDSFRNKYCRGACEYVAEHLVEPIRAGEIAAWLGISPEHLSRSFSQCMGISLKEYIQREKLQQVIHQLLDCDADLRQAADAVGFASTKYLSRLFRQYMGMSITEYKLCHKAAEEWITASARL